MVRRTLVVLALLAAATVGACTLFDKSAPKNACNSSADCYQAQGETCDTSTHTCVTLDAGVQ